MSQRIWPAFRHPILGLLLSLGLLAGCNTAAPPSTTLPAATAVVETATEAPTAEPTSTPLPQPTDIPEPTPPPPAFTEPNFVFQGADPSLPIVTHDPSPAISNLYINPGAVLFHDDLFHMFFNSFTSWPGVVTVGYMQSEDGYTWSMVQDEPVFSTEEIPFGQGRADVSSMVVLDDGTWVMYFHTVSFGFPPMVIGQATAASPLGPWQVNPEPVLLNGPDGAWDEQAVMWPSVGRNADGFWMYYGGRNNQQDFAIGLATSPDGINWTKHNDPETAEALFAESDPVLPPTEDWEANRTDRPRVQQTPDGWVMIYQAGNAVERRGLALSEDSLNWVKYDGNPIFDRDAFPISNAQTWDTNLLYREGTYYYFMELGGLSGTDLYLAMHKGSIRP